jgi:hypothetical protein
VRNFNGQITEVVELKAASGETWHVGVDKIADELLRQDGRISSMITICRRMMPCCSLAVATLPLKS